MKRLTVALLSLALLATPPAADAQTAVKVRRIGYLGASYEADIRDRLAAFRQALHDLGYVEGRNLVIEYRWANSQYDQLPALAAELVALPVDILVTQGVTATWAAKRATTTIPIVMPAGGDAVATGLVASLARPGGNVTGSTFFSPELNTKGLELFKEAVPRFQRVAFLVNPGNQLREPVLQAMEGIARTLKVELQPFEVRNPSELDGAFAAMATVRVDALAVIDDPMLNESASRLATLAAKHRLPSKGIFKEFAEAGGLMAYGVNVPELYRRAAVFVDKILKGAKPADLPVEQPTKFELVINLKTAKALGLTIPPSVLARADELIE